MDLETFIAETLRQIVTGVKTAQEHLDCKGAKINPFHPATRTKSKWQITKKTWTSIGSER